jgi:translation initiation factor 2 beta subunit (eIF-2beta)/eIF-5
MNTQIGLVCSLTDQKPNFEDSCKELERDEKEAERKLSLRMDAAGNVETSQGTNPRQNKIIGIIVFLLGFGVTIASFIIDFGSVVIVAYGSIIYGISRFIKGIHQERILKKHTELNSKIEQQKA